MDTEDNGSLVILAKHTTLINAQKNVLLKFIPKPKHLPIQALHTDIGNFMHRLKTIYELQTTNRLRKKDTEPKDPFIPKRNYTYNPNRLSDSGYLDTFLHRVRLEMLNTDQLIQTKQA